MHEQPKPIIHRVLNSKNILLTDNFRLAKVADFTSAKALRTETTIDKEDLPFMAPEVGMIHCSAFCILALCRLIYALNVPCYAALGLWKFLQSECSDHTNISQG
jgi:serine/threonine protein kinase